uniref:probable galacturonosyltransferase 7 n=1 Tax=Fragaria vesca subsp. vesca TaxID=101020 RepID=UPI0005C7EFFD|nr:PREDICTED: probable galacturonosyltransferase 7 [Fragaria vesca subsp. vesca]
MAYAGKKRWKGLVVGVLGLVLLSMLVPLLFLLGIHNGFQGYGSEQPNSPTHTTPIIIKESSEEDHVKHVKDIVKHFAPPIFKVSFVLLLWLPNACLYCWWSCYFAFA